MPLQHVVGVQCMGTAGFDRLPLPVILSSHPPRRLLVALIVALVSASTSTQAERLTLEDQRTAFQHLTVIEDDKRHERYLYSDDLR